MKAHLEVVSKERQLVALLKSPAAFGAAYLLAAWSSQALFIAPELGASLWLPSGLFLAVLLLSPRTRWLRLTLAGAAVDLMASTLVFGFPLRVALFIAIGNALEAVTGAFLLNRWSGGHFRLNGTAPALAFTLLTALLSPMLSTLIGGTALSFHTAQPLLTSWAVWWTGDAAGVLVFAPLLLAFLGHRTDDASRPPASAGEVLALLMAMALAAHVLLSRPYPTMFLLLPILSWAALRGEHRATALANIVLTVQTVMYTQRGLGPFAADYPLQMRQFLVQVFIMTAALMGLLLASQTKHRRQSALELAGARAAAEAALADAQKARAVAEHASQAKSTFLANMSHEIRTPLHGMLGMAQQLLQAPLPGAQREQVQVIAHSGQLLLGVIDDVLDFSRIEAGRLELEQVPFDLVHLARDAVALFEPKAQAKGLSLQLALEPGVTHAWLLGDPLRLSQIVNNLLSNAVKFTAAGDVVLQLSALDGERWRVAVRDTGIGLGAADQRRILKPFTQADSSTTRRFGGTGLGLSIAGSLVQMLGGELSVDSELGRGTEFSFVLKLPPATAPRTEAADGPDPASESPLAGLQALVAEDNEVNMALACAMLQTMEMAVRQAANGLEAVQAFTHSRSDVVLMDMHMPQMDGLDAARRIRALEADHGWKRTPIVALTASALPEDRQRCVEAGMDDVLVKPFQPAQLQAVLERVCR